MHQDTHPSLSPHEFATLVLRVLQALPYAGDWPRFELPELENETRLAQIAWDLVEYRLGPWQPKVAGDLAAWALRTSPLRPSPASIGEITRRHPEVRHALRQAP
ncbi:hypothetical protein V5P93_004704 [Actinokineospora auranticolor]|uniref:Uncharacterized protein n=1 Tax=Actinokineospora auranticolor TaxID=155976 RepID=A0A2S6GN78_9PSEU|nr:hypothetical protein [Actinokineospora auranticolor]PPK66667.1 hypothetical protein CLV40_10952 [Actinokineospora auranticolor]